MTAHAADEASELRRTVAELEQRLNASLSERDEALAQQVASADILKAISSAFDLQSILTNLTDSAMSLCGAASGVIFRRDGDVYRYAASTMLVHPAYREHEQKAAIRADRGTLIGRVALEKGTVQIPDAWTDPDYKEKDEARLGNVRAMLGVPLVLRGELIGAFGLARAEPVPFTQRQVELVTSFADQAVIAIENARLFNETREALERQTATADVLKVIASSPSNLEPVFEAIAKRSNRLLHGHSTAVWRFVDDLAHLVAFTSTDPTGDSALRARSPSRIGQNPAFDVIRRGEAVHIPDTEGIQLSMSKDGADAVRDIARARGYRSQLMAPLVSEGKAVGWISITRREPGGFAPEDVQLLQTFADQAVIAISNVELFQAVESRTKELAGSLDDLRAAQDRLVQTEKLASLGQLTAGIAHEIKNPLNFINNFSALSAELVDELSTTLAPVTFDEKTKSDVGEVTQMLKSNLEKVVQHGKRADAIVKNMLLHSRESSGERRSADINALVGESLNLAYHGARAEKAGFSITLNEDLDPEAGALGLYPQEMTRALLNLISNGFYAATRRKVESGDGVFEPILSAATRNLGNAVEIRIRDNGGGISPDVREKIFNPFFTTKPTGEGTGLGLSITHDIVVKQHGGTIDVETEPGVFTEFIITLPRDNRTRAGEEPE